MDLSELIEGAPKGQTNDFTCIFPRHKDPKYIVAFDTETHLITAECIVPTFVCLTYATTRNKAGILGGSNEGKTNALNKFVGWVTDDDCTLVGHNIFFDLAVMLEEIRLKHGEQAELETHQAIVRKITRGCIRDTGVLAKLIAIENDWLRFDPMSKSPPRFSLAWLTKRYLNREVEGKEGDDIWRLRYAELDGMETKTWPKEAIQYAVMDAVHTRDLYIRLLSGYPHPKDETFQVESAWWLHLMGVHGADVDMGKVQELKNRLIPIVDAAKDLLYKGGWIREGHILHDAEAGDRFIEKGYYKRKVTVDRDAIKALVRSLNPDPKLTASGDVSLASGQLRPLRNEVLDLFLSKDSDALVERGYATVSFSKDVKALRERISEYHEDRGLKLLLTDKGGVSTERKVLDSMVDPTVNLLAEIGAYQKILTTYVPAFERGAEASLHPRWNVLVATGRVSVSKPNLNNIPRFHGVRECIKGKPGTVIMAADYTQAELCSLAQLCLDKFGFSRMGDAIRAGKDLHLVTASAILGISYEEAVTRYAAKDPEVKDARQLAKALNFGLPGGLGAAKFVDFAWATYKVALTEDRARELKRLWLDAYPEVQHYFDWINTQIRYSSAGSFSYVQHRSGRVRGGCGYCDGCNTGFQGLTADGAKMAVTLVCREAYLDPTSDAYGFRPWAFVYDELIGDVPWEGDVKRANAMTARVCQLMKDGMAVFTPDIPVDVGPTLMYRWSKNAEEVYNSDGMLIPWEEK